jgi:hypothetical protein
MPAEKRLGLHDSQSWPPVEPAPEPDEGETRGIGGMSGFDVALLIQRQLFPQKEIFCRKSHR